jgi:hypothetical protein
LRRIPSWGRCFWRCFGSWRCAETVACRSTLHIRGASDEPFGLGSRVQRGTCPLLPGMTFLSGVVEVGEKAHERSGRGNSFRHAPWEQSDAQVPGCACWVVCLASVLYVVWCSRCGFAVVQVFTRFSSDKPSSSGHLSTLFFLINRFSSYPANIKKK